jgi:hypothetical protein
MAFEKDPDEIGALWLKSGAKGDYMTGTIEVNGGERNGGETLRVVCFLTKKTSDKSPMWRVLKSKPRALSPVPYTDAAASAPDAEDIPF